jgi:homocitrate synthase NifV
LGLQKLQNQQTGINLKHFLALSSTVAQASGRSIPWQKSVVGPGVFTHEAGIHVDGLLKHPDNYQGFDPVEVGREHQIVLGKHSGSSAINLVFARLGIPLLDDEAEKLLPVVRTFVTTHKHTPETEDLISLLALLRSHHHV